MFYKNDWIVTFCFMNTFIKVITVRNDPYRWKDFYALVVYFMIHVWLFINGQHTRGIDKGLQIKANLPAGPFMQFVDKYVRS